MLCSCRTGVEQAKYTVIEKEGKFEVRSYKEQIIAETLVDADFKEAGNVAFGKLFDYISGDNRKKMKISMTSPVSQKKTSEKIRMTSPVTQRSSEGKYAVSFLMPDKYTIETVPEPLDPSIVIREVGARKIAAVTYSGSWSTKNYDKNELALRGFIKAKNLRAAASPIWARYDPPFQLWFFKKNEILIPVE
jgi:hypothetical protein